MSVGRHPRAHIGTMAIRAISDKSTITSISLVGDICFHNAHPASSRQRLLSASSFDLLLYAPPSHLRPATSHCLLSHLEIIFRLPLEPMNENQRGLLLMPVKTWVVFDGPIHKVVALPALQAHEAHDAL